MSAIPSLVKPPPGEIVYPSDDGVPMAESTLQLEWIIRVVGNLKNVVRKRPDAFAAGNQNWYPVEGHPEIFQAPDAYVVFGRPKGHRPSWKQWEEGGVPLTVVFEILSPGNTPAEMVDKFHWYDEHGVEEYYVFDPHKSLLTAYRRGKHTLVAQDPAHGYVSPRLGIRFDLSGPEMVIRYPDGRPFLSVEELDEERRQERQLRLDAERRADDERQRALDAIQRAEDEHKRAQDERQRAEDEHQRAEDQHRRANDAIQLAADERQRAFDAEQSLEHERKRAARLAHLTQQALQGKASPEEQEELRTLLASLQQP